MKSIASIFFTLMLITVVLTSMQIVGEESRGNTNLDLTSQNLINNFSKNIQSNYNYTSSFNEVGNETNATFDSADVFAQEYLEGKTSSTKKTGIISRATKLPGTILLAIGLPEESVGWMLGFFSLIIVTFLGFAGYRAFFGGGKITNN